jgi:hypothetical protein
MKQECAEEKEESTKGTKEKCTEEKENEAPAVN